MRRIEICNDLGENGMARKRTATESLQTLGLEPVERAIQASRDAGSMIEFYRSLDMRNPSRSYFVRDQGKLHSLKAVVTHALRENEPSIRAKDFHASDAAKRLSELRFDVLHDRAADDAKRERQWLSRLARPGQAAFRAKLLDLYGGCALTGCKTLMALEAAHVRTVAGRGSDAVDNGILLRADLHKLFDANLLAINPGTGVVHLADLCHADYAELLSDVILEPPLGGPPLSAFIGRWAAFQES